MKSGLIAIILVNYNGIRDTVECVESILESDYQAYKIIVVDNGSRDKERLLENGFLQEHTDVIISEENLGFSGGNNLGIRYAREKYDPEFFLLLNNDTVVLANTLSELMLHKGLPENTGLVTGKILYSGAPETAWYAGGVFNFNTGIADQPEEGLEGGRIQKGYAEVTFASGCLMLLSKEIIEKIGLLNEAFFLYAEDTDYCCRIMQAGYRLIYAPRAVIYHKVSTSTGRKSPMQQYYMMRNNCYIIQKYSRFPVYGYARKWYRVIREVMRGDASFKIHMKAWKDFTKHITGKAETI